MTICDHIRKDLERGTPGYWVADGWDQDKICGKGIFDHEIVRKVETGRVDARRIARVPQLERIALAAHELSEAIYQCEWRVDLRGQEASQIRLAMALEEFNEAIK